ncbi:tetratricopeptide repeat protein [Dactylosporangium sp. CA-139066]|uniref:tetratricopeptide repeat protein n=1 Tax=Dactylosporangium sp. CA-139066 TaxID=3239930 RepID=UPI003D92FBF6
MTASRHLWLHGIGPAERVRRLAELDAPLVVSAHRRLRGPYTAAGAVLREVVPGLVASRPRLVQAHDVEVLAAAPELGRLVTSRRETQTSLADPKSRTRYYPHAYTTRIAHGITTLLKQGMSGPRTLVIEQAEHADRTDADWLSIMLRRIDPSRLNIVVCSAADSELAPPLSSALQLYADEVAGAGSSLTPALPDDPHQVRALARAYVAGDCTDDDPLLVAAYLALPVPDRSMLHDARADALDARDEVSLRIGAIVHHRLHGTDPLGVGLDVLDAALEHCMMKGYYDAVLEYGARVLELSSWDTEPERCWLATTKMATAMSVMARAGEALALFDAACAASPSVAVHMQAAYGRAMLYTRYFEPERRDLLLAKMWVNNAIAIAAGIADEKRKAYNVTFNENGLALIEMHLGDPEKALQIVDAGLARLDAQLSEEEQGQHRWVLRYNRAQLIARLGQVEQAVRDYDDVIATDPNHSDYYLERAALLRQLGDNERALADYDELCRLALPYPESFYNRGDTKAELGDIEGALADFDYVLELDPEFLDGYVNRAALRYESGDVAGAAADVATGLALSPAEPHLLCTQALLAADDGRPHDAAAHYEQALALDPAMVGAWVNLAVLHYEQGRLDEAVRCFDRALELTDDPDVAANRSLAHAELVGARP